MDSQITKEDILDKEFIQALNEVSDAIQRIVRANEILKKHGLDINEYLKTK